MALFSIVAGPAPIEAFAASELARYLHRMTGLWVGSEPVAGCTIHIGMEAYGACCGKPRAQQMLRNLSPDGFIVRRVPEGVLLAGASPRATLWAAHAWLETFGCRWFFPGHDGEVVPHLNPEALRLDRSIDLRMTPAFTKRGVVADPSSDAFEDWIDFAAKKRLTTVAAHSILALDRARSLARMRGIDIEAEAHLLSPGLCSSDLERMNRCRAALEDALGHLPADLRDYFLWQADGDDRTCDCPADRGLSVTELTLRVYGSLAERLRQVRPAARLAFLIYHGTWRPPGKGIRPAAGLFGEFAPIHRCMAHGVDDPRCPVNSREIAPVLDAWGSIFPLDEAQILDYWLDSSLFGRGRFRENEGRIPHIGRVVRDDARSYHRRGFRSATTFIVGVGREYLGRWVTPPLFQYPALLWDPEADIEAMNADLAGKWLGTQDARPALDALAHVDTSGLEHGRPPGVDEKLDMARHLVAALVADAPPEPCRGRLRRLLTELDFRKSWRDSVREDTKQC